jgi:hypothetical protein
MPWQYPQWREHVGHPDRVSEKCLQEVGLTGQKPGCPDRRGAEGQAQGFPEPLCDLGQSHAFQLPCKTREWILARLLNAGYPLKFPR